MTDINAIEQQILHGAPRLGDDSPTRRSDSESDSDDNKENDDVGYEEDGLKMMDHPSLDPQSGPNTGVKGVRNDAQRYAQVQRAIRADQLREHNERLQSKAMGKTRTWEQDEADRKREAAQGLRPGQTQIDSDQDDDDVVVVGGGGENDDEELGQIRQRRIDALQSQAASNEARRRRMAGEDEASQGTGAAGSLGFFGHLREVGANQYATAIDTEDKSVCIVVHIYVKYVHACAQLTSALSSLARMHTHIKFLQVRAGSIGFGSGGKEFSDEMEGDEKAEEVVPTVLIYRGGELLANLVRVDLEEQWKEGRERDVRDILALHGAPM